MKTIETLVDDIYVLFQQPDGHKCDEKRVSELGQNLAEMVRKRLGEVRGDSYLRMSNLGKGDRQLWYDIKGDGEPTELTANTRIKFLFGDILELLLIFLAEEAGHEVTHKQEEVNVDGVIGHLDAVIDGVVVDCKSASSPSFKKFQSGNLAENDPFGYMEQLAGYVESQPFALGGAFLAIDKQLGHIHLDYYDRKVLDSLDIKSRINDIKHILDQPTEPERCYTSNPEGTSGNEVLGTNCSYCGHKFRCWKDANEGFGLRTFLYSNGPKYFTRVLKEPRVQELDYG